MSILLLLFSFSLLFSPSFSFIAEHFVRSLPFYSENGNAFPSAQYSGYIVLNATTNKRYHYYLVTSENNPSTDPLVFWTNGGPGCSSLDAFMYEQGPFHFDDTVPGLRLVDNPWRWNRVANLLFVEQPTGVGFSTSDAKSDFKVTDEQSAADNLLFLVNFFKSYPEFKSNPLWITGESYAGIYVPMLTALIDSSGLPFNLAGMMVGNGVTDWNTMGGITDIETAWRHALINDYTYTQYVKLDCDNSTASECSHLEDTYAQNMADINIYDLDGQCFHQPRSLLSTQYPAGSKKARLAQKVETIRANKISAANKVGVVPPCISDVRAAKYFNMPIVQAAIHVNLTAGNTWSICSDVTDYQRTVNDVYAQYKQLLKSQKKILVYSGDTDGAVPVKATLDAFAIAGFVYTPASNSTSAPQPRHWTLWNYNSAVGPTTAGFVTDFTDPAIEFSGLVFTTIKGAGHMVPQWRPEAAYHMFNDAINGKLFQQTSSKN